MATLSVALTGNPNTGKSTIFNELTGIRQKIGNWPGVTVDKKVGYTRHNDRAISVMDLPGTYSINGRSPEERIVEVIWQEKNRILWLTLSIHRISNAICFYACSFWNAVFLY